MCATCGCSDERGAQVIELHPHAHPHPHPHSHPHAHRPAEPERDTVTVTLEQRVLAKNDALAERNRGWLAARNVRAINVMSSPGSGKTTLLVRTAQDLGAELSIAVIEGDQETTFDAERIEATGVPVVQVNTGSGCHLDAAMFADALHVLDPVGALLLVENVGNLVCPALFDLGESARVVVMSVTEGADKPLKYPHIFRTADLLVLNKIDLLPYVEFDIGRFEHDLRLVNSRGRVVHVSATRGDGLDEWYEWLSQRPS